MDITIRYATKKDLKQIVEITNQSIRKKCLTAFTEEFRVNERKKWFSEHKEDKYPILIAEINNEVTGWVSISPYRSGRKALEKTVEISYFVHEKYHRKGIGNRLLNEILNIAKNLKYETVIAILFDTNIASRSILEKNNFEQWGFLPEVVEINGNKISHLYYGRKI